MNSETILGLFRLVRPVNMAIAFLTIAAGALLSDSPAGHWAEIVIAGLAGALIVGGGNALNDCFDVEIDRLNRPDRPLPSAALTLREANAAWVALSLVGVTLSYLLTPENLYLAVFWVLALYCYSRALKRSALLGNLTIGLLTGTAFLFGAVATGDPSKALFPGIFAFLVNVAREIVKDVEDLEGDKAAGALTLPVRHGPRSALRMASLMLVLLMAVTPMPYLLGVYTERYLWIVLGVDLILLFVVVSWTMDAHRSNLKKLSGILKLAMVGGVIAIFAGS